MRAPGFWWSLLSAVLAVVVGALLIGWLVGSAKLALLIYFVAEGIFSIMFGLEHQRALSGRWGWLMLNGIIDLFLVGVILFGLPGNAAWVLGLLVGIDLLYGGSTLIGLNRVTEMMPCVLASSGHYLTEMLWGAKRPFGLTPQYIRPISSQRVVLAPGTCHR